VLAQAESHDIAKATSQVLLNFLTRYKTVELGTVNKFIGRGFLPLIMSKSVAPAVKARFLLLLLAVVSTHERKYEIGDYGSPRHSLSLDFIQVVVEMNRKSYSFFVDPSEEFRVFRKRFQELFEGSQYFSFVLRSRNTLFFDEYKFIDYRESDSQTVLFDAESAGGSILRPVPEFPSVFLVNKGLVEVLLEFLEIPELAEISAEVLDFLPDSPGIRRSIAEDFPTTLSSLETDGKRSYLLKALLNVVRFVTPGNRLEIVRPSGFSQIIELFMNLTIEGRLTFPLFWLMNILFNDRFQGLAMKMIPVCLKVLAVDLPGVRGLAADFLLKLVNQDPQTTAIETHLDLADRAFLNADPDSWPKVRKSMTVLANKLPIFQKILPHIDNMQSSISFIADLFVVLVPAIATQIDLTAIFPKCERLIFLKDSSILVSVCDVARSIIESHLVKIDPNTTLLKRLLDYALHCTFPAGQQSLYNLCEILAERLPDGADQILECFVEPMQKSLDRWNYDPSMFSRGSNPYPGLTNLGPLVT
jgi:hypothetical protein